MAIWILTTFSALGVSLYKMTTAGIQVAKALEEKALSQYTAEAAVVYALTERNHEKTPYDTLEEFAPIRRGELDRAVFTYTLTDEERNINVNTSSVQVLSRLAGWNAEVAERIVNSTSKPFYLKEQLLLIEGITQEHYQAAQDLITVYGDGRVNINTAPAAVLKALGMDEELARFIEGYRRSPTEEEKEDHIFKSTDAIVSQLKSSVGLTPPQEETLNQLINNGGLDVRSGHYRMDIQVQVLARTAAGYQIVIDKEKIRKWKEE